MTKPDRIIAELRGGPKTLGQLAAAAKSSRGAVHVHLSRLRDSFSIRKRHAQCACCNEPVFRYELTQ